MGDEGFDDQFDDGLFRTNRNNSALRRPRMWPKSVSEMRGKTNYGGQGMSQSWDTALSDFSARRPYNQQAAQGPPRPRAPPTQQARQAPMPWQRNAAEFNIPFWRDLSSPRNQGW
jgi:hypothetical protein